MGKTCFVVSPIGNEGSDTRKHSDTVFNYLINPVCELNNFNVVRVDKVARTSSITDDIFSYLDNSELVIVDITELNPNVFLELGYRIATKRPYIIIKCKKESIKYPFDIADTRILEYSTEVDGIEDSKNLLDSFIKNVNDSTNDEISLFPKTETAPGLKLRRDGDEGFSLTFDD